MIEIDEGIGRPETLADRLAGDDFARPLQKHGQQPEWLLLKLEPDAIAPKLPGVEIDLKGSEAHA